MSPDFKGGRAEGTARCIAGILNQTEAMDFDDIAAWLVINGGYGSVQMLARAISNELHPSRAVAS
jgi:hypothetical protein